MTARNEALATLYRAALTWAAGDRGTVIVDAAANALVDGLDSPALRYLAGATRSQADSDAIEWAPRAISELGLRLPERLSTEAQFAASRMDALQFLGDRSEPRAFAKRLYKRYVAMDYATELQDFSGLDDWYEMVDSGVLAGEIDELDRATIKAVRNLASGHISHTMSLDDGLVLTDAGEVLPSWGGTESRLLERTGVAGAVANGRLLRAMDSDWHTRVVARTSMHDLLFTPPADLRYPFGRSVRVSWSNDVYTMELRNEVDVVTGDKCFEPNAPAVLSSLLAQLVGGEAKVRGPFEPSELLVEQRIRNRIIEHLEWIASYTPRRWFESKKKRYFDFNEFFNGWDDWVHDKPAHANTAVYTDEEASALAGFHETLEEVAAQFPQTIPYNRATQRRPEWSTLRSAAEAALVVMHQRGRLPEDEEVNADWSR